MTSTVRPVILRAHAVYLGIASVAAFLFMDMRGFLFDAGPVSQVIRQAPHTIIGFVEAHGLAFILAVLFWKAAPVRFWHVTAMATAALLGISNLVFWELFVVSDALVVGYVTTGLHLTFTAAELYAAFAVNADPADARPAYFEGTTTRSVHSRLS